MQSLIEGYLATKGLKYATKGKEIIINCVFNDCDVKTKHAGHLSINYEKGVYRCLKCDEQGHVSELVSHLGDDPVEVGLREGPVHIGRALRQKAKQIEESLPEEDVEAWHVALPTNIREWLQGQRGLSDEVIARAKLGWDGERIVIPVAKADGSWLFAKRRQPPGKEESGPKYQYPQGSKAMLYGAELLSGVQEVIVCEGELDALILRSRGFVAVSGTGGAGTFPEEWAGMFSSIPKVYVVFDLDDAGKKGSQAVGRLIPHARIVQLPEELGEHGDVTDFFMKAGMAADDFRQLCQKARSMKEIDEAGERYSPLPAPTNRTDIYMWRKTANLNFSECMIAGEVGVAVLAQLLIKDVRNPFGLVYVDVPSAGKTITLNFFSDLEELVYPTDSFTPSSLVSHASNRKQKDLEKIDLLPRIRHRMLIVRDLAPIFAERQENLLKNLGVMTRVFDGEGYESDSGVHGKRGYKGDYTFMFLAGSTPIAPRVWKFMGNLGSRLFFLNMKAIDKTEEELADLLIQDDFKRKEQECRTVTRNLILTLWSDHKGGVTWDKKADPSELRRVVSRCAKLLAHLRGTVNVWSDEEDGKQHHTNVVIEKPTRINQLLYNLARGHALVCGRTTLTREDLWPCIEVALNSAQYNRIKLMEAIIEFAGTVNTGVVEEAIQCSNPTALKEIETLRILGIVDVESVGDGTAGRPEKLVTVAQDFAWFCSDECKEMRAMKPQATVI
jgi:hypothetical protein